MSSSHSHFCRLRGPSALYILTSYWLSEYWNNCLWFSFSMCIAQIFVCTENTIFVFLWIVCEPYMNQTGTFSNLGMTTQKGHKAHPHHDQIWFLDWQIWRKDQGWASKSNFNKFLYICRIWCYFLQFFQHT